MDAATQKALFAKFPECFKLRAVSGPPYWPVHFGVHTTQGWAELIDLTLNELEKTIIDLPPSIRKEAAIIEIKEHWGCLVVSMTLRTPQIDNILHKAQTKSYTLCEFCGQDAKLRIRPGKSWAHTLCPSCYEKH